MSISESRQYSRRGVLASVAGLAVSVPASLAAAKRVNKMHFGFTSYVWGREWDIPTLIANCIELKAYGIELRVEMKALHAVELEIDAAKRREVNKRFAGSPVKVLGLATGERFDFTDPEKLKASMEKAKRYAQLSHDIGGRGIRVFPNDFQKGVPQEQTIDQVAHGVNALAKSVNGVGQLVRLENHGSAGRLTTLKKIMDQVTEKNVGIKLNSDSKDAVDGAFAGNFKLVQNRLGDTLHAHDLSAADFPYQLQSDLLMQMGWSGWWLPELDKAPPMAERMPGLIAQRKMWDQIIEKSL